METKEIIFDELFEITISDGFCTWKFNLRPKDGKSHSIADVMKALREKFKAPEENGVLIKSYTFEK